MGIIREAMVRIGYRMANYKKFGDEALKVAGEYFFELGKSGGQNVKKKMGIEATDANAVCAVMTAFFGQTVGMKGAHRIEGNKVILENAGFCPGMEAARMMGAPWETVCKYYSWPLFLGLAASVNPKVTMETPESRIYGKNRCVHIITVPK
jgi:hypothetical protein